MYRVRVTDLDAFDWFNTHDDQSFEDFRKRLLRLEPPTMAMLRGTAFHAMLETARAGDEVYEFTRDGFTFKIADDIDLVLPDGKPEVLGSKVYDIDGLEVRLSGRADYVSAGKVTEFKTTSRTVLDRYMDSYQWRCYLEMFGLDIAEYVIFRVGLQKRTGIHMVYDCDTIRMTRYPDMGDDVKRKIRDFVRFVKEFVPEYGHSNVYTAQPLNMEQRNK